MASASERRLSFVGLRVHDLQRATRFYRDAVGIPLRPDEHGEHEEFSWQGPYLHFALFPPESAWEGGTFLGFQVTDLEAAHERVVAAGAELVHPPRDESWGRTAAYRDPDGNLVQLVERGR